MSITGVGMVRSRDFSIYLLKEGFDHENALKADHKLSPSVEATGLPQGATLFVLDGPPRPPWWRDYFGIQQELYQANKGALVFLPVSTRVFALCFGHVAHNLADESYEYDFGLRSTLNCVDPLKLKNTDVVEPGAARRQRTQLSVSSDLTFFDIDRDSSVLRALTGRVRDEFADIFKQATGSSSLRVSSKVQSARLVEMCRRLLGIYSSDEYTRTFSDIQNVVPVRDPQLVDSLIGALIVALRRSSDSVALAIPELIDYRQGHSVSFTGVGPSQAYEDVTIGAYYSHLAAAGYPLERLTVEALKYQQLQLNDEDDNKIRGYSILRSLLFDTTLPDEPEVVYHLTEGQWYRVDRNFLRTINAYLDERWRPLDLPECSWKLEADYNEAAADSTTTVCVDKTDVSPRSQTQVEPCDLYSVRDGRAVLTHVKISTDSTALSHLFNQGANAVELLKDEAEARTKLASIVNERARSDAAEKLVKPIAQAEFEVVYAIITRKPLDRRSENLPLFSRISLRRCLRALALMNVQASFGYVSDTYDRDGARTRQRRRRRAAREQGHP